MDTVFLHFPWCHLGYAKVAKKGEEMQPQADAVSLHPA